MRDIPFDVLITWPIPNYKDPITFGNAALIVNIIFMSLSVPVVALRIWTRAYMRRWLGWDDFWCVVGLIFAVGFSVATILADYVYGSNVHIWDIQISNLEIILQIAMATKVLFTCAGTAIRQSLLCFYLRLIGEAGMKRFRWAIHSVTALNISVGISFTILCIFQCTPVSEYWQFESKGCLDEGAITLSCGIIITLCDVMTVLLPIPIILRLQMSWRQKLGVSILLNLGLGASAAAAVRTYYIWKALVANYDVTWWAYPLWLAASVELHVAIMAACAPAIRPFIVKHMPWMITPFHLIGDLVSHIYNARKSAKELSAASTTAVSERDHQHENMDAPPYEGTKITPSRSMEKTPFDRLSILERGDDESGDIHFDVQEPAGSEVSLDKEEVLHAVSQAIRGVGSLPDKLFEQHTRPSTSARSSQDRQRRKISTDQGQDAVISPVAAREPAPPLLRVSRSRPTSQGSQDAPLEIYTQRSFELERTPMPSSNADAPLEGAIGYFRTERLSDARNSWARDTETQIPGGNAYGFTGYPHNLGYTANATRQPRAASAERQKKDMPNAFWNRERAKDRKKGRRRSKSLDSSSRRSSDEEQRSRHTQQNASNYASGLSGGSSIVDPLTASIIRQYSVKGFKKTVDIPASTLKSENKPVERWPQTTMRRESLQRESTAAWIGNVESRSQQPEPKPATRRTSGEGQRFSPFPMTSAPPAYTSMNYTPRAQPVFNRNRASREPPRVVRGVPGLSARGIQRLVQQQQDSDSNEGSADETQLASSKQISTEQSLLTVQPSITSKSSKPASQPSVAQTPAQPFRRPVGSGESVSSSTRDARATFLLDDSVDGSAIDGSEQTAFDKERMKREVERRSRMFGGRR